jgi:hypothetical protein
MNSLHTKRTKRSGGLGLECNLLALQANRQRLVAILGLKDGFYL